MANKRFVISERGWDEQDNVCYENGLVFCEYEKLLDKCREYLSDDTARKQIAAKGYDIVKTRKMVLP